MAFRRSLSRGASKAKFRRSSTTKKINHVTKMGVRGGIRL